mgnify:CR=1 FL=1
MAATASNVQLKQPPTDGVTSVTFSPTSPSMLLVSSWDTVRYVHVFGGFRGVKLAEGPARVGNMMCVGFGCFRVCACMMWS